MDKISRREFIRVSAIAAAGAAVLGAAMRSERDGDQRVYVVVAPEDDVSAATAVAAGDGKARTAGAEGIGLFRTEFFFLNATRFPPEEAQRAAYDDEGAVRIIVAHRDPGLPNWLTTAGHDCGTMCLRWVKAREFPEPRTRVVPFSSLRNEGAHS